MDRPITPIPAQSSPEILHQTVAYFWDRSQPKPDSAAIVQTLCHLEKQAKQTHYRYATHQLHGLWRLIFITGTKKAKNHAGIILGPGRLLPQWLPIHLDYYPPDSKEGDRPHDLEHGNIQNRVTLGPCHLTLSGPTRRQPNTNILVFDFNHVTFTLSRWSLYHGALPGRAQNATEFYQQPLKKQAFFTYFWVEDELIAARGRGGGLAVWSKEPAQ